VEYAKNNWIENETMWKSKYTINDCKSGNSGTICGIVITQ
jgi:hypothetical protein